MNGYVACAKRIGGNYLFAPLIAAAIVLLASSAFANEAAESYVQERADEVMAIINSSASEASKKSRIGALIDEHIDVEDIALFTLGKYRNAATDEEIAEFVPLFRSYLIEFYVGQLSQYEGLELKVTSSQDLGGAKGTVVMSTASTDGDEPIEVNWRVAGDSSIVDIEIEGVWMAQSLREQFVAVIDEAGGKVQAAIDHLREEV